MARPSPPRDEDTRLPNGGPADLDVRKLTIYCLSRIIRRHTL